MADHNYIPERAMHQWNPVDGTWEPLELSDIALEVLPDQTGAGGVLTFTFSALANPWVQTTGAPCRVTGPSQTPTANFGVEVLVGSPFPIPAKLNTIKVFAAIGTTVKVYGTL